MAMKYAPYALLACVISSGIGVFAAVVVNNQESLGPSPQQPYVYDFIVEHENQHATGGIHLSSIKMDGLRVGENQVEIHVEPQSKCGSQDDGYDCEEDVYGAVDDEPEQRDNDKDITWTKWRKSDTPVGTKLMTVTSPTKVSEFKLEFVRPRYTPGFKIMENGVEVFKSTSNAGNNGTPFSYELTYELT
jgi:hypothetical protein